MEPLNFDLNEVVEIVGMPLARAKNWAFGRPLRIDPSVRVSNSPGSPNLYSKEDLYRLAMANQLFESGVAVRVTAWLLEKKGQTLASESRSTIWALAVKGVDIRMWEYDPAEWSIKFLKDFRKLTRDGSVVFLLDLGSLKKRVDQRIVQFDKGEFWHRNDRN